MACIFAFDKLELCKIGNPSLLLGFLSKAGPSWPFL
jgi:hypothetical protein